MLRHAMQLEIFLFVEQGLCIMNTFLELFVQGFLGINSQNHPTYIQQTA